MKKDLWLPKGFQLSDGSAITTVLLSGEDWQIYETDGTNNVLLVKPCLQQKWVKLRLLEDALFANVDFGKTSLKALSSPKTYQLATLDGNISMPSKVDAMAFALALRSSRACSPDVSFHDAIYVEQYSKLLPTWTLTSFVEDDVVLGTWITGGVGVSAKSFRRLSNLVGWMSKDELAQVISAAGFPFSNDGNQLVMEESTVQNTVESKIDIGKRDSEHKLNDPLEKPTLKLPGRPMLEDFFNEHVIDIISHADQYSALGIDFPSAIVLYGPPGCGKTYAVERLVEFLDWPCYSIDSNTVSYTHLTLPTTERV